MIGWSEPPEASGAAEEQGTTVWRRRHLLTVADLGYATLDRLTGDAVAIAGGRWAEQRPLAGRFVGLYFEKTSTRTRTSFTVGALRLGAQVVPYGPNDLQIVTGETLEDTGRVLSEYLDLLVVRTNEPIAGHGRPRRAGQDGRDQRHERERAPDPGDRRPRGHPGADGPALGGPRPAASARATTPPSAQILAVAQVPGMRLTLVTPEGYGLPTAVLEQAHALARESGAAIEQHHRMDRLPRGVNVVYTSRWTTMGVPKIDPEWLDRFRPYAVTGAVMAEVSRPGGGTVFLHDLPAMRGFEVTDEVLDGPEQPGAAPGLPQDDQRHGGALVLRRGDLGAPRQRRPGQREAPACDRPPRIRSPMAVARHRPPD